MTAQVIPFKVVERPAIVPRPGGKYEETLKAVWETVKSMKAVELDIPDDEQERFKSTLHYHARKQGFGTRTVKMKNKMTVWAFDRDKTKKK